MRVTILTAGSRGDVQPYVALGRGLAARGHAVTLATHAPFRGLAEAHGLTFRPIVGDPQAMLAGERGLRWLESARDPVTFVRHLGALAAPLLEGLADDMLAVLGGCDALVYGPLAFPVRGLAAERGVPVVLGLLSPLEPTAAFPSPLMPPGLSLGGPIDRLVGTLLLHALAGAAAVPLLRWRLRRGLGWAPPGAIGGGRVLHAYSPRVVPKPADWGPDSVVTGYWTLPEAPGWAPDPALAAFLAAGPPPVYVGFGSMVGRDPARLAETVYAGLALAGKRGVVLSGWAGLGAGGAPGHVHLVHDVPHHWLFPRVSAVVHHGGAGTTAAGLRAGVPAVVAPYFADQPFWAARVAALGVGPAPIPQAGLTADRLATALLATDDPAMRARAAALGEALRAEDGVAAACDRLEAWFAAP